jgi:hypothetical protein
VITWASNDMLGSILEIGGNGLGWTFAALIEGRCSAFDDLRFGPAWGIADEKTVKRARRHAFAGPSFRLLWAVVKPV